MERSGSTFKLIISQKDWVLKSDGTNYYRGTHGASSDNTVVCWVVAYWNEEISPASWETFEEEDDDPEIYTISEDGRTWNGKNGDVFSKMD
jgi:hypothetical protein